MSSYLQAEVGLGRVVGYFLSQQLTSAGLESFTYMHSRQNQFLETRCMPSL